MRGTKRPAVCLLVESQGEDQQIFIQTLSDVAPGSICYIATDSSEALRILRYAGQSPDCIFIDLKGHGPDEKELIEKIKSTRELKDIPVIIRPSRASRQQIDQLSDLGATAVQTKEVNEDTLRELLNRHLE
jgi:CheY-like chemotaxis protein